MGDPSEFFIPARPANMYYRPLKGIVRNVPANRLPKGSVWTAKNFLMIDGAMKRRPGLAKFGVNSAGNHLALSFPVRGGVTLWMNNGNVQNVMWDRKLLWVFSATSWSPRNWTYSTGTASISSISGGGGWNSLTGEFTVTGVGTAWMTAASSVKGGDVFSVASPITAGKTFQLISIISNTKLRAYSVTAPGNTGGTPRNYRVKRAFLADDPYMLDYVVCDNRILFADHNRQLYSYDGTTFQEYACVYPVNPMLPACVSFFNNRVWIANTIEASSTKRRRVRWSLTSNHADFRDASGTDTSWIDLQYSSGEIRKLMPISNLLGAYASDGIFLGVPTNIPALPVDFQRIETGGIGIVGTKAVTGFMGTHFWVGQDDIYVLTGRGVLEPIGSPVVSATVRSSNYPAYTQVCVDPEREQILFAFPEMSQDFVKIWAFAYKTKDWTYWEVAGSSLDMILPASLLVWDTLTGTWSTMTKYSSWDAIYSRGGLIQVFVGTTSGKVFTISNSYAQDEFDPATSIPVTLETGDEDFDDLDTDKCWIRLSIRLREAATAALTFSVSGSSDGGDTWRSLGDLVIPSGQREGYCNFRMTGAQGRFKLESTTNIAPYSIIEAVLRVRGRGLQTSETAS